MNPQQQQQPNGTDLAGLFQGLLNGRNIDPTTELLAGIVRELVIMLREDRAERLDLRRRVDKLAELLEQARLAVNEAERRIAVMDQNHVKQELATQLTPPALRARLAQAELDEMKQIVDRVEAQRKRDLEELTGLFKDLGVAAGLDGTPRSPGQWAREVKERLEAFQAILDNGQPTTDLPELEHDQPELRFG